MSSTKLSVTVPIELLDQINIFKQQLIEHISDAIDEKKIDIKEIDGDVYVSYDDILSLITKIKIKVKD
jgi:hypothetical protein